jgi:SNF2 family DNA or RNA helicase
VILDESQAIKNRKAQRSGTAFALSLLTSFKLCLTGHPYTKEPDELWSQLHFLRPESYPSYWSFFSMHVSAISSYFGGLDVVGARQPKLLRWEVAPFVLRRTKRRVFKSLPRITRVARYVELSSKAENEYKRLKKEIFVELEGREKRLPIINALARTTRIRQFLTDPGLIESKSRAMKYDVILELLNELDGPPVIFTSFAQAAKRLAQHLTKNKKRAGLLIGGARSKKAKKEERSVQRHFLGGKLDALIVTMQKGGSALNLGKYGYVIFLDLPATFKDLEQCEGRVDRPEEGTGKIVPTTAIRIITRGTYEEKTQEKRLEKRKMMFDEVFTQGQFEELF